MELLTGVAALVLALVALVLGFSARGTMEHLEHELKQVCADLAQTRAELGQTRSELGQTHAELTQTRAELDETRSKLDEPPPAPPLPRVRHAGLDDLREQLRAAHRESAAAEEAEEG